MFKKKCNDEVFMRRALGLAMRGRGKVAPNPMVGAVLVKNGKIISEGYHEYFGGPHAEVNALKNVSKRQIQGSTLYVTLEPCCFFGKTPPCTNFLLSKGVKDLVVAMRDPNPLVSNSGISQLRRNGVNVQVGLLGNEARSLNKVFVKNKTSELPYVSIKLGITLDGKIATLNGNSKYITGGSSRKQVHFMRSRVQALLTTSETVLKDNPHLGLRLVKGKDPLRVVIDSKLRTKPAALVYRDKNVLVATTHKSPVAARKRFELLGIELLVYQASKVPLKALLHDLYQKGVYELMTEAGSTLTTSLLKKGLADELVLFVAPKILGQGISWVGDMGIRSLDDALDLTITEFKRFDDDFMISADLHSSSHDFS